MKVYICSDLPKILLIHTFCPPFQIVEFKEREGSPCEVEQSLYFMVVRQASIEDNPDDDTIQTAIPKSYLRAYDLVKLDSFVCTHGPSTKVDGKSATKYLY